jgi:hypothetical protein
MEAYRSSEILVHICWTTQSHMNKTVIVILNTARASGYWDVGILSLVMFGRCLLPVSRHCLWVCRVRVENLVTMHALADPQTSKNFYVLSEREDSQMNLLRHIFWKRETDEAEGGAGWRDFMDARTRDGGRDGCWFRYVGIAEWVSETLVSDSSDSSNLEDF